MKRSGSMKARDNTAFLYERISRDDNLEGDSYSVANQKKLLTKVRRLTCVNLNKTFRSRYIHK